MNEGAEQKPNRWLGRGLWFLRFIGCIIIWVTLDSITARWQQSIGLLQGDPQIGWRMKPHGMVQLRHPEGPWLLRLNSQGYRDHEYSNQKKARHRILSVGGSVSIGYGVPLEDTYSKVLEQSLSDVEIINLACLQYYIDQMYVQIKEQVPLLKPDLVIQCVTDSSTRWIMHGRGPDQDYPKCRLVYSNDNDDITIEPPKFNRLQRFLGYSSDFGPFKINFESVPDANEQEPFAEKEIRLKAIRALLMQTSEFVSSFNSKYVVLYVPQQVPDSGDVLAVLRKMSEDHEITLINAAVDLENSDKCIDGPEVFVSKEDRHLTEYGHYLIAKLLRDHLNDDTVNVASE